MREGETRRATKPKQIPARTRLAARAQSGGITLVVGAGVSLSRGVPDWESLAHRLWLSAFKGRLSPWKTSKEGLSPRQLPQFLPIIFELAYRELGEPAFLEALKSNLYSSKVRYPADDLVGMRTSNETLAVIARLIVQEYKRGSRRRIDAVITFNVDDLIEQAVHAVAGFGSKTPSPEEEVVRVVARATHSHLGGPTRRAIPVFHIHGFVPSNHRRHYLSHFDHMLVFTDTQYWSTSAGAATFANRVIASALGEGRCVFVGLSMTDINLLRWLALRTIEKDRDLSEVARAAYSPMQKDIIDRVFGRHFWIRTKKNDPTGFISEFLSLRGVESVEIKGWQDGSLRALIEESFPPK